MRTGDVGNLRFEIAQRIKFGQPTSEIVRDLLCDRHTVYRVRDALERGVGLGDLRLAPLRPQIPDRFALQPGASPDLVEAFGARAAPSPPPPPPACERDLDIRA